MDQGQTTVILTNIQLVVGILALVAPPVLALIATTAWGKKHKEELDATKSILGATQGALGTVVEAVGRAKKSGGSAYAVTENMRQAEKMVPPAVMLAWKSKVAEFKAKTGK